MEIINHTCIDQAKELRLSAIPGLVDALNELDKKVSRTPNLRRVKRKVILHSFYTAIRAYQMKINIKHYCVRTKLPLEIIQRMLAFSSCKFPKTLIMNIDLISQPRWVFEKKDKIEINCYARHRMTPHVGLRCCLAIDRSYHAQAIEKLPSVVSHIKDPELLSTLKRFDMLDDDEMYYQYPVKIYIFTPHEIHQLQKKGQREIQAKCNGKARKN